MTYTELEALVRDSGLQARVRYALFVAAQYQLALPSTDPKRLAWAQRLLTQQNPSPASLTAATLVVTIDPEVRAMASGSAIPDSKIQAIIDFSLSFIIDRDD